jgi:hypothetical protein
VVSGDEGSYFVVVWQGVTRNNRWAITAAQGTDVARAWEACRVDLWTVTAEWNKKAPLRVSCWTDGQSAAATHIDFLGRQAGSAAETARNMEPEISATTRRARMGGAVR